MKSDSSKITKGVAFYAVVNGAMAQQRQRHVARSLAKSVSFEATKKYLIECGFVSQSVLDAPTEFHLREVAKSLGFNMVDLELAAKIVVQEHIEAQAKEEERAEEHWRRAVHAFMLGIACKRLQARYRRLVQRRLDAKDQSECAALGKAIAATAVTQALMDETESVVLGKTIAANVVSQTLIHFDHIKEPHGIERIQAAKRIQATMRRWQQLRVNAHAMYCVAQIQRVIRGRSVRLGFKTLRSNFRLLRQGAAFMRLSEGSTRKPCFVWLDTDLKTLCWCDPSRRGQRLKSASMHRTRDAGQFALVGAQTKTVHNSDDTASFVPPESGSARRSSWRSLSRVASVGRNVFQSRGSSFQRAVSFLRSKSLPSQSSRLAMSPMNPDFLCFSIVLKEQSLDLVAGSPRMRDDWVWALRTMLKHWQPGEEKLGTQSRMRQPNAGRVAKLKQAIDVLGETYVEMEAWVLRLDQRIGMAIDCACNVITSVTIDGPSWRAGLREGDVVVRIEGFVVTALEGGYIKPLSHVRVGMDPAKERLHVRVLRRHDAVTREPAT